MKNVVNYILSAQKKIFVMAFLAVFSSFYTVVWGAVEYSWNYSTKTLTINKAGALESGIMPNYDELSIGNKTPWTSCLSTVQKIILADGITYIGKHAFYGASNLAYITIPASVTSTHANAFNGSCSKVTTVYYKGSPSEWASINFGGAYGHPFGAITKGNGRMFFYEKATGKCDSIVVLLPTITEVNDYAFYNAKIRELALPGTIETIGNYAFDCNISNSLTINRVTPPSVGTNSFTFSTGGTRYLYIRSDANTSTTTGYKQTPWYDYSSSGNGATQIGYSSDGNSTYNAITGGGGTHIVSGNCGTPTSSSVHWTLSEDGTLTIQGNGSLASFSSLNTASNVLPWYRFRRLVYKVVVQGDENGDITSIENALQWNWAMTEVTISQNTIPTSSVIGGNSTTFGNMFNTRDNIKLIIRKVSEEDAELSNDPWNNARWERSIITCDDFTFWYGTTKGSEDHYECLSFVEGSTDSWLSELWTIPSANQWTYVGKPNWDVANAKSANLQLSNMPYALNHANNLGTIGTNVMEGAQGYIKICSNSNDNNKYVGFIPAGYVLRWGTDENGWSSIPFVAASENIEEENWNTPLHTWTSDNAAKYTYVGLKTSSDYVWANRSETRRPVFLKPTSSWDVDGANFAVYYFTSDKTHTGWSAIMTDPDEDGIYEAWIPNDYAYTSVIFVRLNTSGSTGWDKKWNQTVDLALQSDKNVFTIESGSGDAYTGSWSLYDKKGTFHISANSNTNNWYCHFLPHHVLTYNANGGEGAPATQYVAINADPCQLTVSATEPTRTGYYFLGWSTSSTATSPDDAWDPGDTHAMTGDVTLYAVWSPATLTFNASEDANWNNANNWSPSSLPTINHEVIINKPATVNTTAAQAKSVVINQKGDKTGQLVVDAGQKLIVAGTIQKTTDGETYSATEANDIIINSDATHGLGALVMGTHDGTNKATVNFTTLSSGTSEDNTSIAQYVGTPFNDETNILHNWYNSWVYGIDHTGGIIGWERVNEGQGMTPFKGYCVFSADGTHHNYWQQGTLVASENQTISGLNWQSGVGTANPNNENLLANSWMAPIKINAMAASDFTNTEATVYIFNSTSASGYTSLASNYSSYTPGTAGEAIIPSMQSFSVFTNAEGGSSVALDYNKIVYQPALSGTVPGPNHAPRRAQAESEEANKLRLFVRTESGYGDLLYMWERSDFSEAFENGWDGHKLFGESVAPQLFALSPDGDLAINCIPSFEGVQMGFKAGEQDNSYTFTFEYSDEAQPLYLLDISTNTYTQITSDTSYSFTTTDTDVHNRFVLTYNAPSTPTALETTPAVTTGKKVMYDNHLFILHNGRIFSAQGAMIQ